MEERSGRRSRLRTRTIAVVTLGCLAVILWLNADFPGPAPDFGHPVVFTYATTTQHVPTAVHHRFEMTSWHHWRFETLDGEYAGFTVTADGTGKVLSDAGSVAPTDAPWWRRMATRIFGNRPVPGLTQVGSTGEDSLHLPAPWLRPWFIQVPQGTPRPDLAEAVAAELSIPHAEVAAFETDFLTVGHHVPRGVPLRIDEPLGTSVVVISIEQLVP